MITTVTTQVIPITAQHHFLEKQQLIHQVEKVVDLLHIFSSATHPTNVIA